MPKVGHSFRSCWPGRSHRPPNTTDYGQCFFFLKMVFKVFKFQEEKCLLLLILPFPPNLLGFIFCKTLFQSKWAIVRSTLLFFFCFNLFVLYVEIEGSINTNTMFSYKTTKEKKKTTKDRIDIELNLQQCQYPQMRELIGPLDNSEELIDNKILF